MTTNIKTHRWCFTAWKKPVVNEDLVDLLVWQKETCPKTALTHYQGYIEFKRSYLLFSVKSIFKDKTMHIEPALKDREANVKYCTKARSRAFDDFERHYIGATVPTEHSFD